MNLTLHTTELKRLAALLRPLNLHKSNLPVLQQVRLEHAGGTVTAFADNLDMALIAALTPSSASGGLHASVPAALLARIAREADKDSFVKFTVVDGAGEWTWITQGVDMVQHEPIIEAAQFPSVDTSGFTHGLWMKSEMLAQLDHALSHVSTDECRYVLNGVFLDATHHTMVATDGRRMLCCGCPVQFPCDAILPTAAASYLVAHAGGDIPLWFRLPQGAAASAADSSLPPQAVHAMARLAGNALFTFRCIDQGRFPNYRQVIPRECYGTALIAPGTQEALITLLKRAGRNAKAVFSLKDGGCYVRFAYERADGRQPSAWQQIGTSTFKGEGIMPTFSLDFIIEALESIPNPTLHFTDEMSPVTLTGAGSTIVIMPVRTEATSAPASRPPAQGTPSSVAA